tara:strand:- start:229 stop:495 length:267 start_codon:yes stop_codon:yes gene_type:complete
MEKLLIIASIITFMFSIMKVIEMKYVAKQWTPLKYIIRDAVMVFGSALLGLFVFFQINGTMTDLFNVVTDGKAVNLNTTQVFTDAPGF